MADRLEDKIKVMIVQHLMLKAKPDEIGDDDDLIEKWKFDSVKIMEVVVGLEEHFGVVVGDDEFTVQKFRTVKNIAEVVRQKQG